MKAKEIVFTAGSFILTMVGIYYLDLVIIEKVSLPLIDYGCEAIRKHDEKKLK